MTAGPDRPRRIVGCCKAVRERVQVGSDAGLRIIGHDRGAPCCWSGEDYVGGTPVEHPRHGSTDDTGTVLDQARSNSWMVTICWSVSVESGCGAVVLGRPCRLPPLSS